MRLALLFSLLLCLGSRALAGPLPSSAGAAPFPELEPFRRDLTLTLIGQLQEPRCRQLLAARLRLAERCVPLGALAEEAETLNPGPERRAFALTVADLEQRLARSRGLAEGHGLLGVRPIWPGPERDVAWDRVLFAVQPQGPARAVTAIEAYDLRGRRQDLDPWRRPGVLVLMAGTDPGALKRAGLAVLNAGFRRAGFAAESPATLAPQRCAKLTYIRLADSQEPWWKGAAEVFAFTAGIDPNLPKPALRVIDLPYLGYADTDYFPNQLILFWDSYRFGAADFQLWEQDDDRNYQDLLASILRAVTGAMASAGALELAWLPALAEAIIKAMPSSWFQDGNDYLDTFYTLERERRYDHAHGAANNAVISLEPYLLQP